MQKSSKGSSSSKSNSGAEREGNNTSKVEEKKVLLKITNGEITQKAHSNNKGSENVNTSENMALDLRTPKLYEKKPGGGLKIKEIPQFLRKAKSKSPSRNLFFSGGAESNNKFSPLRSTSDTRRQIGHGFQPMAKTYDQDSIEEGIYQYIYIYIYFVGSLLAQEVSKTKANVVSKLLKGTQKTAQGIKLDTQLLKERELHKFKRRRNEQLWNAAEAGETKLVATLLNKY